MNRQATVSAARARWASLCVPVALAAEVLVFYRHVLFGDSVFPWDFRYYHFPIASFTARAFAAGRLPLWDPYTYCGLPFYAGIQNQVFYPPTAIAIGLSNLTGGAHLLYWMELQLAAHVFLAGIFTYLLLRELGAGSLASFLGATVFELGPFFASQTQHLHAVNGAAWIPLACWATVRLAREPSRRWIGVMAIAFAMAILAGFNSSTGSAVLCCGVLAVALWLRGQASPGIFLRLIAAGVLSLGIAAIVLLPTIELSSRSVSMFRGDFRGSGWGMPVSALVSLIFPDYYSLSDLSQYRMPADVTLMYLYCGLLPLVFVAVALWKRANRYTIPFAVLTVFTFVFMMGDNLPVSRWFLARFLDLTHDAMYTEFVSVGFSLGIAVLAGLGADWLRSRPGWLVAACLITVADLVHAGSGLPMNATPLAVERGITENSYEGSEELVTALRSRMERTTPPTRFDTYQAPVEWVLTAPLTRLPTAGGADPLASYRLMQVRLLMSGGERWGRYYQVTRPASPVLDLVNVEWLLSQGRIPDEVLAGGDVVWEADLPGHVLYRNNGVLPRFFLVSQLHKADSLESALNFMGSADFLPGEVAVMEDAAALPESYPEAGEGTVRVVRYADEEVEVEVHSPAPAFLVSSESDYPGWQASIDGVPAPIVETDVAFRGLQVPAGEHRIIFRFAPTILRQAGGVSAVALLICAWLLFGGADPWADPRPAPLATR